MCLGKRPTKLNCYAGRRDWLEGSAADRSDRMTEGPRICDYGDSTYRQDFWEGRGRDYEDAVERRVLRQMLPQSGFRLLEIGAGFGTNHGRIRDVSPGCASRLLAGAIAVCAYNVWGRWLSLCRGRCLPYAVSTKGFRCGDDDPCDSPFRERAGRARADKPGSFGRWSVHSRIRQQAPSQVGPASPLRNERMESVHAGSGRVRRLELRLPSRIHAEAGDSTWV